MRRDEQDLIALQTSGALNRLDFALTKASWVEAKRQRADAGARIDRCDRFEDRMAAAVQDNTDMLAGRLVSLRVKPGDLFGIQEARADALEEWNRRDRAISRDWPDDEERAGAARQLMEDLILRRFAARINAERQQALGIDQYIWRSHDDARVRPAHAAHDDRIFAWDEPPEDGHPGEAYNCRCFAEPYLPPPEDWRPTIDAAYFSGIDAAILEGAAEAVIDFLPSLDDLLALLEGLESLVQVGGAAVDLAYLVLKDRFFGLSQAEAAKRDALLADAQALADGIAAAIAAAPEFAEALIAYVAAVESRPEALDAAYRQGHATRADVEAAYRERTYLRTLAALNVAATAVSAGLGAQGFLSRLLQRRGRRLDGDDRETEASLVDLAARALTPGGDFARIPDPGIPWVSQATSDKPVGIKDQGEPWEVYRKDRGDLGDRLEKYSRNYPSIDFFDKASGLATSAKTLDTHSVTYTRDRRAIFNALKRYIDRLARFDGSNRRAYRIEQGETQARRLELAIPSGTTIGQFDEINRARAYAESLGIDMDVTIIE